jgi:hypothetical protein
LAKDGEENPSNELNNGVLKYIQDRDRIEKFDDLIKELQRIISFIENKEKAELSIENIDKNIFDYGKYSKFHFNFSEKISLNISPYKIFYFQNWTLLLSWVNNS